MEDDKRRRFEDTVIQYFNTIYNSAYRMTGERGNAEDLVQDVFLSAYKSFHQFIEGTNCKAWLFKILKNTFINKIRKEMREVRGVQELRSLTHQLLNSITHQLILMRGLMKPFRRLSTNSLRNFVWRLYYVM